MDPNKRVDSKKTVGVQQLYAGYKNHIFKLIIFIRDSAEGMILSLRNVRNSKSALRGADFYFRTRKEDWMNSSTAWNGVIVSRGQLTHEDETGLERHDVRRIRPIWSRLFERIRIVKRACLGEPYQPHFSLLTSCPCFKFIQGFYKDVGLEVETTAAYSQGGLVVVRGDLTEGDLVYFRDARLPSYSRLSVEDHVAIVTNVGIALHTPTVEESWEGNMDDLLKNGVFVIGRRLVCAGDLATFRVPTEGKDGFSLGNADYLRSFL